MLRLGFIAGVLIGAVAASGQIRENPNGPKRVEHKSPDATQVLTVDYEKSSMSLRSGDAARWTASLDVDSLWWTQYWVSNRGWVALVSGSDRISIHEPDKGTQVWSISLHEEFARHGWSKHVHKATDGPPKWDAHALCAFREVQGAPCFVVRPWWGDRVIIDLQGRRLIDDADEAHDEIVKQESEWVLSTLREVAALPCPNDREPRESWRIVYKARMAAHLAGQLRVKDATEFLKTLEKWDYKDRSVSNSNNPVAPGTLDPTSYFVNTLRQAAQLSLRRLGLPPTENAPVSFFIIHPDRQGDARVEHIAFPRPDLPRPAGAKSVRIGMTVQEVGKLLGGPDGIVNGAWEYEIDEGFPRTVRIGWTGGQVATIERIEPRWRGTARDEEFLY